MLTLPLWGDPPEPCSRSFSVGPENVGSWHFLTVDGSATFPSAIGGTKSEHRSTVAIDPTQTVHLTFVTCSLLQDAGRLS
jgi:hypothetical protein